MSASYVALTAELPDLEELYPIIETESPAARQAAFIEYISEQFDTEYEEDLTIEDIAIDGGRLVVEFQTSTELCNEITQAIFDGLAEREGSGMLALEHNSRVGLYTCMAPGYDEAEYVDECFEDFDGMMHELEDFMDRRDQLMRLVEMTETEPLRSRLREFLGEDEEPVDMGDDDEDDEDGGISRASLMEDLQRALADGDEERASALFSRVQQMPEDD